MEATNANTYDKPESAALWPVVLQGFLAALIVGKHVIAQWQTWGSGWRAMAIAFVFCLVWGPSIEIVRRLRGEQVRFNHLAMTGYTLVWMAAVLFGSR